MVDRAWRFIATGLAFVIFGVGALAMSIFVFPIAALFTTSRTQRADRTRHLICRAFAAFVGLLRFLRILTTEFENRVGLAGCRSCLIVANHPTLLDVVILMSVNPRVQCIVKHQLWRNFFLRGVVRWADFIRNDLESDALLGRCVEAIDEGSNLLVFPEGTRTVPDQPITLRRGFANIAISTRARIQTVVIACDQPFLCKGYPWYRVPRTIVHYRITVGECWEVSDFSDSPHRSLNARRLLKNLEALFRERLSSESSERPDKAAHHRDIEAR